MKKTRIAQATLVCCLSIGMIVAVPSFLWRFGGNHREGVILVNGRIEGTEVSVGTRIPGRVSAVHFTEGQNVRKGDLLVELESDDVQAAYQQAKANVSQAKHYLENSKEQVIRAKEQLAKVTIALGLVKQQTDMNIRQAKSAVKGAQAAVDQAKALASKAKTQYEHSAKLYKEDVASELEFIFARDSLAAQTAAVRMAEEKLNQANQMLQLAEIRKSEIKMKEHDLEVMKSTVRQSQASVGVAEASLQGAIAAAKMIEIKLKDAKIFAPCDGVVVTRVNEPGEVVGIGSTVMVLVDFGKLYLKGYLPNNMISKIKLNDPVRIYVDAFEDKFFSAKVTRINQQAEFTPKTVDIPKQRVKLVFGLELQVDNSKRLLKPGMPADAIIKTDPAVKWCLPKDLR